MNYDEATAARVIAERETRRKLSAALDASFERDDLAPTFGIEAVRRHLRMYYGGAVADAMYIGEVVSAVRWHGGDVVTRGMFKGVRLRKPTPRELSLIADEWGGGTDDPPLIPRVNADSNGDREDLNFTPGARYKAYGVHRTIPLIPSDYADYHDGEIRESRKRRFPAYIVKLKKYLEQAKIDVIDRAILELICEGRTIRWIAEELGMKRPTVHKRVVRIRREAGIAGPGPGR